MWEVGDYRITLTKVDLVGEVYTHHNEWPRLNQSKWWKPYCELPRKRRAAAMIFCWVGSDSSTSGASMKGDSVPSDGVWTHACRAACGNLSSTSWFAGQDKRGVRRPLLKERMGTCLLVSMVNRMPIFVEILIWSDSFRFQTRSHLTYDLRALTNSVVILWRQPWYFYWKKGSDIKGKEGSKSARTYLKSVGWFQQTTSWWLDWSSCQIYYPWRVKKEFLHM